MADSTHNWEGCRFYRHVSPYTREGGRVSKKAYQNGELVAQTRAHRICIDPVSKRSAGRFYSIPGWIPRQSIWEGCRSYRLGGL
jgi:hypothetical protein